MSPENKDVDIVNPVDKLVNDAVTVISRKGTRENRKKAYEEQLVKLRIREGNSLDEKADKILASTKLRKIRDELLLDTGPDRHDLELHRGSKKMAKDPGGKR